MESSSGVEPLSVRLEGAGPESPSARISERTTRIELATASLATMPRTLLASALLVGPLGIEPR